MLTCDSNVVGKRRSLSQLGQWHRVFSAHALAHLRRVGGLVVAPGLSNLYPLKKEFETICVKYSGLPK